ncbi:MAG: carboxy terminal-processing peptidase [Chthoniobacterales bacterium]
MRYRSSFLKKIQQQIFSSLFILGIFFAPSLSWGEPSPKSDTSPVAFPLPSVTPTPSPLSLSEMGPVAATVGRILEQGHFLRLPLNDPNPPHDPATPALNMPQRVLKNYLQFLDYNHLYFTQADISEFEQKYEPTISADLLRGDLTDAKIIYDRFRQRVEERVAKNKILVAAKHDFSSNHTIEVNRQKAEWPRDGAAADQLWDDRIEAELLQEKLNKNSTDSPTKIITHRYDQMLKTLHEQKDEDVARAFLIALSESYDPHSEYMSPSDMENFNIQMRLSLIGIGAVLRSDDGYTRIVEVVPGGPADRDGRLKENDRITAVAQGSGPFEDVIDLRLDKVVEKVRGKKGSQVRLQVIPADATDPSKRVIIEITRDEVKLKESEVKAELITIPNADQKEEKFGWLTIPAFYSEMDRHGAPDAKSTTKDVRRLLARLKKENIQGLVIDLRRNGGGSLEEAINLTGLFIGAGPVVQAKDSNGNITISFNHEPAPFYDGPVIVLTNTLSASASEIFAGALQDYHRAVIVGDQRTFGKGTVQTVLDVGKFMPLFQGSQEAGSLKLTIQKFYRVSGGSTQHKGVLSDIVLPSLTDTSDIGEGMLPNPLIYDEVDPQPFHQFPQSDLFIDMLKQHSQARVEKDLEFRYLEERRKILMEKIKNNSLSLNEEIRKKELADEKKRTVQHKAERTLAKEPPLVEYAVTLDTVDNPILSKVIPKKKKIAKTDSIKSKKAVNPDSELDLEDENSDTSDDPSFIDPVKREAIAIVQDLKNLRQTTHTASLSISIEKK